MRAMVHAFDLLEKTIKVLMAALIAGMVVLIATQVCFRYVLNGRWHGPRRSPGI